MGKVLFMRKGETHTAPAGVLRLSDIAEGSIVKLNENGSPVEFYVAKHDYESGLNGTGRTLLVRKDCYDSRIWSSTMVNAYTSSDIDTWLKGTYINVLDTSVRNIIGYTKFYYTKGNGDKTVKTLSRSIFLLSVTELGRSHSWANTEGSALPIASILQIAYFNGSAVDQWTRSPHTGGKTDVFRCRTSGTVSNSYSSVNMYSRPCFTLPSSTQFDGKTMQFKGVA